MSTLSQFGFGGGIKSIQRGTIALPSPSGPVYPSPSTILPLTQTATIIPVNTSKSILYYLGVRNGYSFLEIISISVQAMIELTNSTTITATIGLNYGNYPHYTTPPIVSWQLVEYY